MNGRSRRVREEAEEPGGFPGDYPAPDFDWARLSRNPRKRRLYADDPCFRTGLADFIEATGAASGEMLARTAALTLKPDAIVKRSSAPALRLVREHGFKILFAQPILITPPRAHWIWRFQWNRATMDRLRLATYFLSRTRSIVVLVEAPSGHAAPATVLLSRLKGSADGFEADSLRGRLGMSNRLLSLVHVADEPADLIRDCGALFDRPTRIRFWLRAARALGVDRSPAVLAEIETWQSRCIEHDLDPWRAAQRHGLERFLKAPSTSLAAVERGFGAFRDERDRWDFICLAAHCITHLRPGVEPLLPSGVAAQWPSSAAKTEPER